MGVRFRPERLDGPAAAPLIAAMLAEYDELYPTEYADGDEPAVLPEEFEPPGGLFVVAVDRDTAVGCGGYRPLAPGVVELKRMYVAPLARGRGLAGLLLAHLESVAAQAGAHTMRLEVGDRQPHAIRLYERTGYRRIPAWDASVDFPPSRCYEKSL